MVFISGTSLLSLAACNGDDGDDDGLGGAGTGGTSTGGTSTGGTSTGGTSTGGTSTGGTSTGGTSTGGIGGVGGAGTITAECETYCDEWFTLECNDHDGDDTGDEYEDVATCESYCANNIDQDGTDGDLSGDTVQCRITHLGLLEESSADGLKDTHCGHTKKDADAGGCL